MTVRARSQTLASLLENANAATVRGVLLQWPLQGVADALVELPLVDQARVLRILPTRAAVAVFEYLPTARQRALLPVIPQDEFAVLLNDMAPDDRTLFLSELPGRAADQLMALLDQRARAEAEKLLSYPADSVGRLMTPHYVAIRSDWSIQRVLDHIRAYGRDSETLNVLYVIDEGWRLIDNLRVREILLVAPPTRVAELMTGRFTALRATDDQRAAVEVFRREDRTALPVVDDRGVLIGIVTIDDILNTAQELATRDLQRVGGSEALGQPYLSISLAGMIKKRAGWLTILLLGEMLTATAMGYFEHEIARAVVLALFVPLIISSGGNSGSQASTLVIRALALGELTLRDWWKVIRREIALGASMGLILGSIGFLRIAGVSYAVSDAYGPHATFVGLTVGLALAGVVLWGALVGAMLPFALRRLRLDPATSSAPLVATVVDVTGLLIYFSIGSVVLRGTLL
jgi:magnesium transporter